MTGHAPVARSSGRMQPDAQFESHATRVLTGMRDALKALLDATPGSSSRAVELADSLGIHTKLAWQTHRVANATEPLAEAANFPSPTGVERLLDAASRRGAPAERVLEVKALAQELNEFIRTHAGSRAEFETMVSALAGGGHERIDLAHKRAAFRAQSHIFGVQARTHLGCMLVAPSASNPRRVDFVSLRGLIGLRRFRRDCSWVISQTRNNPPDTHPVPLTEPEHLDPDARPECHEGLLTGFCSKPLPQLRRAPGPLRHMTNIEILGSGVGNASSVTCLLGDVFRECKARYKGPESRRHISNARVRTPTRLLVQELLLHQDLVDEGAEPKLSVFSDHRDVDIRLEDNIEARACDILPLKESLIHLGKGPGAVRSRDVPRYEEMIRYATDRVGWDPASFHIYRARIEYPVMPSSVVIHFELPEDPAPEGGEPTGGSYGSRNDRARPIDR